MKYFDLFLDSISIAWRYKYLWLFGLFAIPTSSTFSSMQVGPAARFSEQSNYVYMEANAYDWNRIGTAFAQQSTQMVTALAITSVLGLAFVLAGLLTQSGMITTVGHSVQGRETNLHHAIGEGARSLLPMLTVTAVLYGPYAVISLLVGQAFIASGFNVSSWPFLVAIVVLYPLGLVLTAVYLIAQRGLVIQRLGVWSSIADSWRFLRQHFKEFVIVMLVLIVFTWLSGIVTGLILLPLATPTIMPTLFTWLQTGSFAFTASQTLLIVGVTVLGLMLNIPINVYQSTVLTLMYCKINNLEPSKKRRHR